MLARECYAPAAAGAQTQDHLAWGRFASLTGLTDALLDIRPLAACFGAPLRIRYAAAPGAVLPQWLESLLLAAFRELELAPPLLGPCPDLDLGLVELAIERRLAGPLGDLAGAAPEHPDALAQHYGAFLRDYRAAAYYHGITIDAIKGFDGVGLTTYRSRTDKATTVVMVLPSAMPFQIARAWFDFLSDRYNVVTWETRCAFNAPGTATCTPDMSLQAQANDLLAVIAACSPNPPHVMGVCGGAVVALAAAQYASDRFGGLSLWYGDYNFFDPSLQTDYQKNLQWMMETASASLDAAESVFELFNDREMLKNLNERHALSILCPYAGVENLHRYAHLNGAIMAADIAALAAAVPLEASVITSALDQTAHPGGSRRLAQLLARASLHVEETGDHLCFFDARPSTREIALACIEPNFAAEDCHVG